jgi:predicted nucleic acid-binding protein
VSSVIVLDTTPLGILCHPKNPPHVQKCRQWLVDLQRAGRRVILPEIADYELRRDFLRRNALVAIKNLDNHGALLEYLPLTTAIMRHAAELWAHVRNLGKPTAPDHALDGDAMLAAQALSLGVSVIVAKGNPGHLFRFVAADDWTNIKP